MAVSEDHSERPGGARQEPSDRPPSDGQLLDRLARGEGDALSGLVARHQAALLRHARAVLGSERVHEDVVQEAFLKLLERPPVLPNEVRGDADAERAHLSSWLHKVTRNGCMDTLRSESRRRRREENAATADVAPRAHVDGAALVEARDTRAAVERGLAKLSVDQREVLVLRLLSERSYKEIAEITGKKIGTVGWLVSEGLKALSVHLSPLVEASMSAQPAARASQAR